MKLQYDGILTLYYETGMEGMWGCLLQDYRGITKNDNYDPKSNTWPNCTPVFHDLKWAANFKTGDFLEVFDETGKVLYSGTITKDREAIRAIKYALEFIPKEIELNTWITWLKKEYRAKLTKPEKIVAENTQID